MIGFDWNGNGKRDGFDDFIEYKLIEEANGKSSEASSNGSSYGTSGKQSNKECEVPLWKSVLVILLCAGAIVLPAMMDMGKLLWAIILIGISVLGYKLLSK